MVVEVSRAKKLLGQFLPIFVKIRPQLRNFAAF
jgi:hypothetical protein